MRVLFAISLIFCWLLILPVSAEERYKKMTRSTLHSQIANMLAFLVGSWVSEKPGSAGVEAWTYRPGGILIGFREVDGPPSTEYQAISIEPANPGSVIMMRRMSAFLRDIDVKKQPVLLGNVSADCMNRATVSFSELHGTYSTSLIYDSPSPDRLDLEVKTVADGVTTTKTFHYKRVSSVPQHENF